MSSDEAPLPHLVFVYGTLKRGEPNHHWMTGDEDKNGKAKLVGTGRTQIKYPLVIASRYNIPFLMNVPGKGHQICGEVYRCDDDKLRHLDVLEDYPKLYDRRPEKILMDQGQQGVPAKLSALMYFVIKHKEEMLGLDLLSSYESAGSHGKPYNVLRDDISDAEDIDVSGHFDGKDKVHADLKDYMNS